MPKTLALLVALVLACLAIVPAANAGDVTRAPTKVEKRGVKKALKANGISTRHLKAIVVHRKNPKYAAACFRDRRSGFEGHVFKRGARNKWRLVTGGSGWTGNKPVRELLGPCAGAAS
jgi:hypothetical protein